MHQNVLPPQFIHTRNCTDYIVERNIVFDAQSYHAYISYCMSLYSNTAYSSLVQVRPCCICNCFET